VQRQVIINNPMANIPKGKVDEKPIIPFSHEQVQILLNTPDKSRYVGFRDVCIMMVLIDTGMRINECLNMKIEDIDFETGTVILKTTKNRTSRVVGISEPTRKEIKRFMRIWLPNSQKRDSLFQSFDGSNQLAIRSFQGNLTKYGQLAGIEGVRCSPHTYRHYFAINFLKNGGSILPVLGKLHR